MSITREEALQRTIEHREIFFDEMVSLMRQIMAGEVSPVMLSAILAGLRTKKETIGEIAAAGKTPGEDVLCAIGPNNAPVVVNGDIWVMPSTDGELSEAQAKIATLTTSIAVQSAFTTAMGSLPIRSGVDTSNYNACAAAGAAAIETGNSVSALMIPFSPEKIGALGAELKVLWVDSAATPDDYVAAVAGVLESY